MVLIKFCVGFVSWRQAAESLDGVGENVEKSVDVFGGVEAAEAEADGAAGTVFVIGGMREGRGLSG